MFLGCRFAPGSRTGCGARGALIFPRLPDLPFDPYRAALYDADELYGTGGYAGQPGRRDLRLVQGAAGAVADR